jgi:Major Facilitator Superfamily
VHALAAAGDAMITVALAGSLFFSIDPSDARWRVGLYLALTIAPFAVVSPMIGPALDRSKGGRRAMVVTLFAMRAVVAALMVTNLDSLFLFPLAFAILVLQKAYAIAKAALVPTTVRSHDELIEKNAKLALLGGISAFAGAAPAALAQLIGGPSWSVAMGAVTFTVAMLAAIQLPRTRVVESPEGETEKRELRAAGIVLASSAMGVLRGVMGFFTFLVAFAYRGGTDDVDLSGYGTGLGARLHEELLGIDGAATSSVVRLGAVLGFSVLGGLTGSLLTPRIRARIPEERILLGALAITSAASMLGVWSGGIGGAMLVGYAVGLGVSAGKLAFDSIVQRDAPDANYGRTFARFETRFQLTWVIGALVPVVFTIPAWVGFLLLSLAAGFAAFSYFVGSRNAQPHAPLKVQPPVPQPLEEASVAHAVDATTQLDTGRDRSGEPTLFDIPLDDL